MREEVENREKPARKSQRSLLYIGLLAAIVLGSVASYAGWWVNFRAFRPEFSAAEPLTVKDEVLSNTILLWRETVLTSPVEGVVHYPQGREIVRVAGGDVVAEILSGNGKSVVRAPFSGYFVCGTDGMEGKWEFSKVWPGDGELPKSGALSLRADGEGVGRGNPVGKLIPQPQELRGIAYIGMDAVTRGQVGKGFLMFSVGGERPKKAGIRAVQDYGSKAKVYFTLPFFPTKMVSKRNLELEFFHGEKKGVVLPESALMQRDGGMGVYAFSAGKLEYRSVKGQPLPKSRFLVTEGLKAGDLVLSQASLGEERKVLLW